MPRTFLAAALLAAATAATPAAAPAQPLVVDGPVAIWHSPNMAPAATALVTPGPVRLGDLAYDNHFLGTGRAPDWNFLTPLRAPAPGLARIEGDAVVFAATGKRFALRPDTLPDVATPAAPYLLGAPAADSVLVVEPFYLFRNKETAYRVSAAARDGAPGPRFDSLPTHALAGAPDVLVAPERAGCCENMTWSIRFYDLAAGRVSVLDCPAGRCGDLVLARPEKNGPLVVAMEVFETMVGLGSVVETRLAVVAPDGTIAAAGRIAHAARNATTGLAANWTACASRVLVAKGSPYAVANMTAARRLDDGRWAFRFDSAGESATWTVDGVSDRATPPVVFASKRHQEKG